MDLQRELLGLAKRVKQLESKKDKLRGSMDSLKKRLKDKHDCETEEEVESLLEELEEERDDLQDQIATGIRDVEELL